jgi:hypothetical protein
MRTLKRILNKTREYFLLSKNDKAFLFEKRLCGICNKEFTADTAKEPMAVQFKKKYCSDDCLNESRKRKTYAKRRMNSLSKKQS